MHRRAAGSPLLVLAALGCGAGDLALPNGSPSRVDAVAGSGQTAVVGESVTDPPSLQVRDAAGDPVAGAAVRFRVTVGAGAVRDSLARTDADGIASSGRWTLGAQAGLNRLEGSVADASGLPPVIFNALALSGPPSPVRSSLAADPATLTASRGDRTSLIAVTVVDRYDNPLPGIDVTLASDDPNALLEQPGPTDGAGKTSGRFSATAAGPHTITASVAGSAAASPITVVVVAAAPLAQQTSTAVPGGRAGDPTQVRLRLRDEFDNPVTGATERIGLQLGGANAGAPLSVREVGGGEYEASYTPTKPGADRLAVSVAGSLVPGSPFSSEVSAGPADAAHSEATVPQSISLFDTAELVVRVRDRLDNIVGRGGDNVGIVATVSGVRSTLSVRDNGDGTYTTRFKPAFLSRYSFAVTVNGEPVAGSPFLTQITFF